MTSTPDSDSNHMFDLTGRTVILTGASRGLGQQMARALAKAGANLVITSRQLASLGAFQRELSASGCRVEPVEIDVTVPGDAERLADAALAAFGRVDVLVNNAGMNIRKPAVDFTWEEWDAVLNTNLKGAFFCAKAIAPAMMRDGGGRIINIGSATSVFGMEGIVPYAASRGGILQLTRALAAEWGKHGITANVLAPGWFRTAQNNVLYESEAWVAYINERIPLGRPGQPTDLDGAIVFLASDASAYVTGQMLLVDGGFTTGATKATVD